MNSLENQNIKLQKEFNEIKVELYNKDEQNDLSEVNLDAIVENMKSKQNEIKKLKSRMSIIQDESIVIKQFHNSYSSILEQTNTQVQTIENNADMKQIMFDISHNLNK